MTIQQYLKKKKKLMQKIWHNFKFINNKHNVICQLLSDKK